MKQPTILDVAKRAGVSHATVSMVINNRPSISEATTRRVLTAIRELRYVRPPAHRRRGPRPRPARPVGNPVSLHIVNMNETGSANPVYMAALRGVDEALAARGCSLMVRHVALDAARGVAEASADGGHLLLGSADPGLAGSVYGSSPAVWMMGGGWEQRWCDHVGIDDREVTALAARFLRDRGHARGLYVGSAGGFWGERAMSFQQTFARQGGQTSELLLDDAFFETVRVRKTNAENLLRERLAALSPRPTGIFAGYLLPLVMRTFADLGWEHRRDFEAVTADVEWVRMQTFQTPVAVVDVHPAEIGRLAVAQLDWRQANPAHPRVELLIEPRLIALSEGAPELGSLIQPDPQPEPAGRG